MRKDLNMMERTLLLVQALHTKFSFTKPEQIIPVAFPLVMSFVEDAITSDLLELDRYDTLELGILDFIHNAMVHAGILSVLTMLPEEDIIPFDLPAETDKIAHYIQKIQLNSQSYGVPVQHTTISPAAINTLLQAISQDVAHRVETMTEQQAVARMFVLDEMNILLTTYPQDKAERLTDRLRAIADIVRKNMIEGQY